MRKSLKILIAALLAIVFVAAMAGCEKTKDGLSAYEIAVKNGFEGTEQEWLDSLKGADGVNGKDGKDGVDGQNGVNGKNGVDGKDNMLSLEDYYNYAVENGFEGSKLDFINDFLGIEFTTDNKYTVAKNLLSSVSVVCGFQVTTYNIIGNPWYGYKYDYDNPIISTTYSAGSGVIYHINKEHGDAYVITNYHVVYKSDADEGNQISKKISVYLYGGETAGQEIPAEYIGGAMTYDLAVLKIEGSEALKNSDVAAVTFANSNEVSVGQTAIAIGNAEGEGISATAGIISVDSESFTTTAVDGKTPITFRALRIDTPINGGNSGGGLFDSKGNLIGIVNMKISGDDVDDIGYAIPANIVKYAVENILDTAEDNDEYGCVNKCMLGVTVISTDAKAVYDSNTAQITLREKVTVHEEYDEESGTDTRIKEGALVYGTLKHGDVIKTVKIDRGGDGTNDEEYEILRSFVLTDLMLTMRVGDKLTLVIERTENEQVTPMEFTYTMTDECIKKMN